MKKPIILFIQGGAEGAFEIDKKLILFLKNTVGDKYDIKYPKMPNEQDPNYDLWKLKIDQEIEKIDTKVIFMGHSVGSFILLKYLSKEKINKKLLGLFFISTPFVGEGGWQFEGMALENDFASKLPSGIPVFFYHSTNDEVVPFSHLELYAKKLPHATFRNIVNRGHQLNNELSEIVQDIKVLKYFS